MAVTTTTVLPVEPFVDRPVQRRTWIAGALLGVPVAATAMALLEIYKRRYELTADTEARVAALVAPSAERAWGDKDDDEGPYAGPSAPPSVAAAPATPAGADRHEVPGAHETLDPPPPGEDHPDGKEPT